MKIPDELSPKILRETFFNSRKEDHRDEKNPPDPDGGRHQMNPKIQDFEEFHPPFQLISKTGFSFPNVLRRTSSMRTGVTTVSPLSAVYCSTLLFTIS